MAGAGADVVKHYRELAFMGFVEVVRNLGTILRNLQQCKKDILAYRPDALVLIDYPGFNLRMAKWAKKAGIPVIYYISPQIWAWHASRVRTIRRDVDKMLVILPFEQAFYEKYGVSVLYTGHPLLDALTDKIPDPSERTADLIVLLPGSRQQEISRILPEMLRVTPLFPEYRFVIAGAPTISPAIYETQLQHYPKVALDIGNTHSLLCTARAALVKSGTSTLEAALLDIPQVVCYKGSPVSYAIAKRVIQVPYISLVNLIVNAPLVQELIQQDLNTTHLQNALKALLDPVHAAKIRAGYQNIRQILGAGGASEKAAAAILNFLNPPKPS
jgi:lipid-A-disaccharide synthase